MKFFFLFDRQTKTIDEIHFFFIVFLNNRTFVERDHRDRLADSNSIVHEHFDHRKLVAMNQLKDQIVFKRQM